VNPDRTDRQQHGPSTQTKRKPKQKTTRRKPRA
jgi:hypothetical protein